MPGKVVQFEKIRGVTFFRNRRSKSVKISVKPDKSVLVSYPFYCSSREVAAFIDNNESWILAQQKKMEQRRDKLSSDSKIETKLHTVQFLQGNNFDVSTKENRINITVPDFESEKSQKFIEEVLIQIYRVEAKKLLPPKLDKLSSEFGFRYNKVTIRNNKRNWGSCSNKNNISLNLQMMKLPDELIDYILLHELVHTEIKNHGAGFWEKLNSITNNRARELAKQVKQYSTYTL